MVGPSLNTHNVSPKPIKFICSYGGRIAPRYPDGKLRYHGGDNRVLSVDRSISFLELFVKMVEMCGTAVSLKCQLPNEDLDALVSITSDEDLVHIMEEYDRAAAITPDSSLKIKAFLFGPKTAKKTSPPLSPSSSSTDASSPKSPISYVPARCPSPAAATTIRRTSSGSRPPAYPVYTAEKRTHRRQYSYGNCSHVCLVHDGYHCQ